MPAVEVSVEGYSIDGGGTAVDGDAPEARGPTSVTQVLAGAAGAPGVPAAPDPPEHPSVGSGSPAHDRSPAGKSPENRDTSNPSTQEGSSEDRGERRGEDVRPAPGRTPKTEHHANSGPSHRQPGADRPHKSVRQDSRSTPVRKQDGPGAGNSTEGTADRSNGATRGKRSGAPDSAAGVDNGDDHEDGHSRSADSGSGAGGHADEEKDEKAAAVGEGSVLGEYDLYEPGPSEQDSGDRSAPEARTAPTGQVSPVLPLGAGFTSIGLGLGLLALRFRRG